MGLVPAGLTAQSAGKLMMSIQLGPNGLAMLPFHDFGEQILLWLLLLLAGLPFKLSEHFFHLSDRDRLGMPH